MQCENCRVALADCGTSIWEDLGVADGNSCLVLMHPLQKEDGMLPEPQTS